MQTLNFVTSFKFAQVQSAKDHLNTDDTALNGVKLYCKSFDGQKTGEASSGIGAFGSWSGLKSCQDNGLLNGFRFRAEGGDVADKVFGTNFDVSCDSGETLAGSGVNDWGDWSSWTFCPATARVCGLQTKIQADQGEWKDDVALSNIKIKCCEI